jgi:hypothetical protein
MFAKLPRLVFFLLGGSAVAACSLEDSGTVNGNASSSSSASSSASSSSGAGAAGGMGGGTASSSSGMAGGGGTASSSSGMGGGGGMGGGVPCPVCSVDAGAGKCMPVEIGTDDCTNAGELCDDKGACACGISKPPIGGTCPTPWVAGPTPGSCLRQCDMTDECKAVTTTCPAGFDCIVECTGNASCSGGAIVQCPAGHACTVKCNGNDACKGSNVEIRCSADGPCKLECGAPGTACDGAKLVCGDNACSASCATGTQPTLVPNMSCSPMGC